MHVSLAIVAFRNAHEIAACLEGLAGSTYSDFDVVICENGGEEAYRQLVAAVPTSLPGGQPVETILSPSNLGFAGGVNVCMLARPDADAWWVVNPDTVPDAGALAALVARLAKGDCDAVGGTLHSPAGRVQGYGGQWKPWLARAVSLGSGASIAEKPDAAVVERDMNYLLGACMLVSRSMVARRAMTVPLAVSMAMGIGLLDDATPTACAVRSDKAVMLAPLSISMSTLWPLISARAQ